VQCTPYAVTALLTHALNWWWIRISHPALGTLRPVTIDWRQFLSLAGKSFWVYLYCVAASVSTTISTLLITARFGPETLVIFRYNSKLCELAWFVVSSACVASLPKITQWLASPDAGTRGRALREAERLNKFQTLLGCSAVLVYLAVNDWFIRRWLGQSFVAPLSWQAAFAATLALTSGGQTGFELASRCSDGGIRVGGIAVGVMALVNLGLSLVAMKMGSILGIALATVVTYSVLTLGLGWYACRHMKTSWWRLSLRNCLLALAVTMLAVTMRVLMPIHSTVTALLTGACCLAALLLTAFVLGIRIGDLRGEFAIMRGIFGKR
jgi:O-antigen/teichoic acid export membrane protein